MYKFLNDIRVLDLTSVVLGPYATQFLGDFGADVIKIEPPTGDVFRHVSPAKSEGMGAGFLNLNRNKRSAALDLKDPADLKQFRALLDGADVLVHNMRGGAASRLGLDPSVLRESHPRLVYCAAPGFGSRGSQVDRPAYDDIIQAASGLAHLNRGADGAPRFVPAVVCDKVGGVHLAMAVLAGLIHRLQTGDGCYIEVPMFEVMASFTMIEQLAGETFVPARGNLGYDRLMSPNRKPFATKDGYIAVLPYTTKHWVGFLSLIGRNDLAQEAWLQQPSARSERIDELYSLIATQMPGRPTDDWLDDLEAIDVPCVKVNSLDDLLTDSHLREVGLFSRFDHPTEATLRAIRSPFWADGVEKCPDLPAPRLETTQGPIGWRCDETAVSNERKTLRRANE